jgi:FkbM family methyltransferase
MEMKTFQFKGITIKNDLPISDVPCGSCFDCCSKLTPHLTDEEFKSGKYAYTFMQSPLSEEPVITIPKAVHGGCMYLVNNKCSIYNDRPISCRQFDCRNPETSHQTITNKFKKIQEFNLFGFNFKMKLHEEDELYSYIIRFHGTPDLDDVATYTKFLQNGDVYIDVGANIGFNAIIASKLVGPTGKVYAFEPDAKNFELLKYNIEMNELSNVILIQKAVMEESKTATLMRSRINFGDHRVNFAAKDHYIGPKIECVSLDDFFESLTYQDLIRIKLIKIDAQGSDAKVLQGGKEFFRKHRPHIIIEFAPAHLKNAGNSPFDIFSFIERHNYIPNKMNLQNAIKNNVDILTPLNIQEAVQLTNELYPTENHEDLFLLSNSLNTGYWVA